MGYYGNKYHAKKTVFDNRTYDSRGEARLAQNLSLLLKSGQIISVEPQVTFQLYGKSGTVICKHIVDFLITNKSGNREVYEFKGVETTVWKLKYNLFKDNYPEIRYHTIKRENL